MYRKSIAILLICLFPVLALSAQTSGKTKKITPVQNEKGEGSGANSEANQGAVDDMQQQYLKMQYSLNSDIQKEYRNIDLYRYMTKANHDYIMRLYDTARQYGTPVNRARIKETEEEQKRLYDKIDSTKLRIADLEKEKEKLKMDALKYYKGKFPDSLSKAWQEAEELHSIRLPTKRQ